MDTGRVSDVDSRIFYARAVLCRLGDGVHLGVDGSKAVLLGLPIGRCGLIDQATDVSAVRHACRGTVVTGCEDVFIPDDDRPDLSAGTCGAFRDLLGYGHEILIPAQALAHE